MNVLRIKKNSLQAASGVRTSGVFEGSHRYCSIIPDYTGFHTNEISLKPTAISEGENNAQKLFYCTLTFPEFFWSSEWMFWLVARCGMALMIF